jgi:hypothetical protein
MRWSAFGATPTRMGGGDLSVAIGSARDEIAALRGHLQAVRTAPLPKEDMERHAHDYVARLQRSGKVSVGFVSDDLKLSFRGDMFAPEGTLAMIAQFAPEQVLTALEREIDALPTRVDAMPRLERVKRVGELEAQLLELERR